MSVALNKTGHCHPAGQVYYPRLRADQRCNLCGTTDGDDPLAPDGDRVSFRLPVVERNDLASAKYEIGGLGSSRLGWHCGEKGCRQNDRRQLAARYGVLSTEYEVLAHDE